MMDPLGVVHQVGAALRSSLSKKDFGGTAGGLSAFRSGLSLLGKVALSSSNSRMQVGPALSNAISNLLMNRLWVSETRHRSSAPITHIPCLHSPVDYRRVVTCDDGSFLCVNVAVYGDKQGN